jgi:hypothetical protein
LTGVLLISLGACRAQDSRWTVIKGPDDFPAVDPSLAVVGDRVILHGGFIELHEGVSFSPSDASWVRIAPDPLDAGALTTSDAVAIPGGILAWNEQQAAVYDATADTWGLASPPLAALPYAAPAPAVIGDRVIWVGGEQVSGRLCSAQMYDIDTDTWSLLPTDGAPSLRNWAVVEAAGDRVVVWGGITVPDPAVDRIHPGGHEDYVGITLADGAIYDVPSNTWSAIATDGGPPPASLPIGASGTNGTTAWTGSEVLMFSMITNYPEEASIGAWALDPAQGRWRQLASDVAPPTSGTVWTGDRLIALDEAWPILGHVTATVSVYDAATDAWSSEGETRVPWSRHASSGRPVWIGDALCYFTLSKNLDESDFALFDPDG